MPGFIQTGPLQKRAINLLKAPVGNPWVSCPFRCVFFSQNIKQFSLQEVLVTRGCRTPIFLAVSMQTSLCLTSPCFAMKSGHVCKKTHKDSCHGRCVRRSHVASSCSFRKLTHSMRLRCWIDLGIETNMVVILVPKRSMHGILTTASTIHLGNKWPATKCQAFFSTVDGFMIVMYRH